MKCPNLSANTMPFFIRDCNGDIVGNPKGYRTIKGAILQAEQQYSRAYNAIWVNYQEKHNSFDPANNLVYSIKQG